MTITRRSINSDTTRGKVIKEELEQEGGVISC